MKNVIALLRVSSERQENEGCGLDVQADLFNEQSRNQKWNVLRIFRGQESASGAASEREILQEVLGFMREHSVRPDLLWIYDHSRLIRADEEEVLKVKREIQARNVIIRLSSGQEYDLSTIDGELLFNVQSSFTRADGRRIKERMIAAKIKRAKQGHKGCGIVPYGYTVPLKGDKILQMQPEQAAIVQRIFREAGQ